MRRALFVFCALLITASAVLAAACAPSNNPAAPTVALGSPFDLKVGSSAIVAGDLAIRFEEVSSDSRCPMDAICVWAGEATLVMTLSASPRNRTTRELRTTPNNAEVTYSGYSIKLAGLRPYPRSGLTIGKGDYIATLSVTKN